MSQASGLGRAAFGLDLVARPRWSLSALRATATTCRPSFARRLTIAAPMPREPPVTNATRFSVMIDLLSGHGMPRALRLTSPPFSVSAVASVSTGSRRLIRFASPASVRPGASSTNRAVGASATQRLHRLLPPHRLDDLLDQQLLDRRDVRRAAAAVTFE